MSKKETKERILILKTRIKELVAERDWILSETQTTYSKNSAEVIKENIAGLRGDIKTHKIHLEWLKIDPVELEEVRQGNFEAREMMKEMAN